MADMRSIINVINNFDEIIETMKVRGSGNPDEIANLEMNTNLLKAWAGITDNADNSGLHLQRVSGACDCEIVDARNEVIESGYMCIKCGKLFKAHDH